MVLGVLEHVYQNYFPSAYTTQIIGCVSLLYVVRAFSRGRRTSRDRTLHARTVLLTSPFTSSLGITLLRELASRGATIICLSDRVGEAEDLIVTALREEFNNESIFVESCDMANPPSIQNFVANFLKKENTHNRIDAIIFTHEYPHVGSWLSSGSLVEQYERDARSLGTFLLVTLLLPNLLVAPAERDIRIINVVNPWYAAAARAKSLTEFPTIVPSPEASKHARRVLIQEGSRSLRGIVLSRHLQRILDALPAAQVPKTAEGSSAVPVVSEKSQRSNIVSVSVCPGYSRHDTIAHFFPSSIFGNILYFLLFPLIWLITKPASFAVQTVLHALFLPTPFKESLISLEQILSGSTDVPKKGLADDQAHSDAGPKLAVAPGEILKAGALYRECGVVNLPIERPLPLSNPSTDTGGKSKSTTTKDEEGLELPDDDEYGGEFTGRVVWESFEAGLKRWEEGFKNTGEEEIKTDATQSEKK